MTVDVMLDTATPMFILWGPRKTFLFNEAYAKLLGGLATHALGSSLPELWSPIWERVRSFVDDVYAGEGGLAEDIPLPTWASGAREIKFYTFAYTPLKALSGEVMGAIVICTDTTDRVQRVHAVEQERNKLLRLFMQAPGFTAALEGPDHVFSFTNDAYLKLVGSDDLVGKPVREALPQLGSTNFFDRLDEVFQSGVAMRGSRAPLDLGAEDPAQRRYVDFIIQPIMGEEAKVSGIIVQGHDVTEEVEALEKVRLLQKELIYLSRMNAMGAMASTLAHELNQPLTAIQNYAAGSERLIEQNASVDELRDYLGDIRRCATRAGEIIRRLRNMTRSGEISKEPFIPDEIIKEAGVLASVGACAGARLEYHLADGLPVMGDPIQIQQVLINLIRNACEATMGQADPKVKVTTKTSGNVTILSVEDNGPGIPPDHFPVLFDAFFSTKPDGMGVGLSISRTIIEGHGGRISAENRPDGGARFSFTLPLAEPSAAPG
jgi:signal transduction histidine kinase